MSNEELIKLRWSHISTLVTLVSSVFAMAYFYARVDVTLGYIQSQMLDTKARIIKLEDRCNGALR